MRRTQSSNEVCVRSSSTETSASRRPPTVAWIRAAEGADFSSQPHFHETEFQLVYVLKGWIEFEYEGQEGVVRLEAGSCVHQPPGIRHREVGHSADVELLEVVMPATFKTVEVASVQGAATGDLPPTAVQPQDALKRAPRTPGEIGHGQ